MKKIDFILIYLLFLLGIFPLLNSFIPQWSENIENALTFKSGLMAIDVVLLIMFVLTLVRFLNGKYKHYNKLGLASFTIFFAFYLFIEIIRNIGKYGISAPGEFRFRYLILILPFYIALNFNTSNNRKKLVKIIIFLGYFIPLFYIPIVGIMKGWIFGAENRFLNSQIYLGMVYSLALIYLSIKYNYINYKKSLIIFSLIPFTFFFVIDSHRSTWLSAFVIILTLFFLKEIKINKLTIILPFMLFLGIILIPLINDTGINLSQYITERGSAYFDPANDASSNFRLIMWDLQLEKFYQNPILGEGFGGYWKTILPNGSIIDISPHSYYIQTLVKLGLIGLLLSLIFIFILFKRFTRIYKITIKIHNQEKPLLVLGIIVIISMIIYNIVYSLEYYSLIYLGVSIGVLLDKNNKFYESEYLHNNPRIQS